MAATATASTTAGVRSRARYTRVAALGLALAATAPLIFIVAGLAAGLPTSDLGFFAVFLVVPAIVAALVWRFGIWAKVLGVLVSLAMGLMLFWVAFGLGFPSSFVDFVPGLLLPVGVLMGLGGSIAAIVAKARGRVGTEPTPGERRITTTVLAVVALAAVVSGILSFTGRSSVDASTAAASSTMREFAFEEASYEVAAGDTIAVHNSDPVVHDFAVPGLGIEPVTVLPGSSQLVEIGGDPGSYVIYCTLHSDTSNPDPDPADGDMVASLVVN